MKAKRTQQVQNRDGQRELGKKVLEMEATQMFLGTALIDTHVTVLV